MAVLGAPVFPHGNLAFFVAIFSEMTRLPAGVGLRLHSIHPSITRESKWRYIMKKINLRELYPDVYTNDGKWNCRSRRFRPKPCPRQYPPWLKAARKIFLIKFHLMRLFFAFLSVLIRRTSFPPSFVHWQSNRQHNGCVYFTSAGLQEYIAKCTHRAKPAEKNATYRKPRRAGVWAGPYPCRNHNGLIKHRYSAGNVCILTQKSLVRDFTMFALPVALRRRSWRFAWDWQAACQPYGERWAQLLHWFTDRTVLHPPCQHGLSSDGQRAK